MTIFPAIADWQTDTFTVRFWHKADERLADVRYEREADVKVMATGKFCQIKHNNPVAIRVRLRVKAIQRSPVAALPESIRSWSVQSCYR